ncbi:hypothetical protein N9Q76_02455 [Flavobacteriales bacterium]|nr:hypothetical protein [Flavobacteriales bacterium]
MRIKLFIVCLMVCVSSYSQISSAFIKHLVVCDLNTEHNSYLNSFSDSANIDSLGYFKLKFNLLNRKYDVFLDNVSVNPDFLNDSSLLDYSTGHLLKWSILKTKSLIQIDSLFGRNYLNNSLIKKSLLLVEDKTLSADFLPSSLRIHFDEFEKTRNKKAWVGGVLATVLPGAGKLYIGRGKSFLGSLMVNAFYGATAYESIHKFVIKNPYSILTTGVFSAFYLSNIYGTVFDLKRIKIEKKKHFLYEVADYQSSGIYLY